MLKEQVMYTAEDTLILMRKSRKQILITDVRTEKPASTIGLFTTSSIPEKTTLIVFKSMTETSLSQMTSLERAQ